MSVARDSFTRRMRPRRSAASGVRIWERMWARWSAVVGQDRAFGQVVKIVGAYTLVVCDVVSNAVLLL